MDRCFFGFVHNFENDIINFVLLALLGNFFIIFVFYVVMDPDVSFGMSVFYYTTTCLFIGLFFVSLINIDSIHRIESENQSNSEMLL